MEGPESNCYVQSLPHKEHYERKVISNSISDKNKPSREITTDCGIERLYPESAGKNNIN